MSTLRSLSLGVGLALAAGAASLLHAPAASAAEEPLPFELAPPVVEDMLITPTPQSGQGDALLQLIYAKEQQLPGEINFNVGDKPVVLRRDEKDPQLYSASIPFDFEGFIKEQSERKEQAGQKLTVPTFVGREFRGEAPMAFLEPETLRKQIELQLPIRIPFPVVFGPPALVRPERSLLINAPSVVEDPTRTFDLCTGAGNPNGAWTFNTLMTNMANQPVSGVNPADFVENWMRQWGSTQVINTFPAAARAQVINQVLNAWERDSVTGKLNLKKSPFRALAFLNRMDLRTNSAYGGGTAGEGRIVFGAIRRNSNGSCSVLPFTVILEYGIPITGCTNIRSYARQWGALGTLTLGSPAYNAQLQVITDRFTAANAAPSKPNRSAINQVRTNEFLQNPWELREFAIARGANQLTMTTAKQTPHHSLNNSVLLGDYIWDFSAQILAGTYQVPLLYQSQRMLTGAVPNGPPQQFWNGPGAGNDERNKFSLNTCNACHGAETQTTNFLHIAPRASGATSLLSRFLIGNNPVGSSLANPGTFTMNDPFSGTPRTYGDLKDRATKLSALQNNACLSGGVFHEALSVPLLATH
ncbi:hypothetical protein ACI2IY_08170 [Lysobacter enzymogenes]|uniref:hypothetical protein n=1 Tax=Lysobacter enzymogenes TaxID=69 RepID=UPI00384DABFC